MRMETPLAAVTPRLGEGRYGNHMLVIHGPGIASLSVAMEAQIEGGCRSGHPVARGGRHPLLPLSLGTLAFETERDLGAYPEEVDFVLPHAHIKLLDANAGNAA